MLFTVANLPSEMFDSDGTYPAQNGGGDIRFTDSDGTTLLPAEIWAFTTNANPALGTAFIWVKCPNVRSSTADTIRVYYNSASTDSQPAAGAANGSQAVWSAWEGFCHDPATDVTGNYTPSVTGTTQVTGPFGNANGARGFGATNGSADTDIITLSLFTRTTAMTYRAWVYDGGVGNTFRRILDFSNAYAWNGQNGQRFDLAGGIFTFTGPATGSWYLLHCVFDITTSGQTPAIYVNGSAQTVSGTSTGAAPTTTDNLDIGNRAAQDRPWEGYIAEIGGLQGNLSSDWVATEYSSQSDPANFITVGTPTLVSGGGGSVLPFIMQY